MGKRLATRLVLTADIDRPVMKTHFRPRLTRRGVFYSTRSFWGLCSELLLSYISFFSDTKFFFPYSSVARSSLSIRRALSHLRYACLPRQAHSLFCRSWDDGNTKVRSNPISSPISNPISQGQDWLCNIRYVVRIYVSYLLSAIYFARCGIWHLLS